MDHVAWQRNLSWLNAQIRETETRLVADKKRLAKIEIQGDNPGPACRMLAVTTEYLTILNMRRDLLHNKLHWRHEQEGD